MKLIELTDSIFQYICFLKRNECCEEEISFIKARQDITNMLDRINTTLLKETHLWRQYKRVKLSLLFFVDSMICELKPSFYKEWDKNRLAYEKKELTGDMIFFREIESLLNEYCFPPQKSHSDLLIFRLFFKEVSARNQQQLCLFYQEVQV